MSAALAKLSGLKGWNAEYFNSDMKSTWYLIFHDPAAFYSISNHTMYTPFSDANEGNTIHEMIHAWNHLSKNPLSGSIDDEGMAYLAQFGMTGEKSSLVSLESTIRTLGCNEADKYLLEKYLVMWTKFWTGKEKWNGKGWGPTEKSGIVYGKTVRARQQSDFVNLNKSIGLNFSCKRQSAVINALLVEKGCCLRVRCTSPERQVDSDGFHSSGTKHDVEIEY